MRYKFIQIKQKIKDNGKLGFKYYLNNMYPEIPLSEDDIYIITTQKDRYDLLAQQYFNDVNLWWIIPCANPEYGLDSLFPPLGAQIRIPQNTQILSKYRKLNNL